MCVNLRIAAAETYKITRRQETPAALLKILLSGRYAAHFKVRIAAHGTAGVTGMRPDIKSE